MITLVNLSYYDILIDLRVILIKFVKFIALKQNEWRARNE